MVVASVEVGEVELGQLGLGARQHFVVESVGDSWFARQEPQERLEGATGVHHRVGFVVRVDDLVVGVSGLNVESDEALARGIGAVAFTSDTSAGTEVSVLAGIVDFEVTISSESGVSGFSAGGVVSLEELTFNVLLLVPGAHVGSAVEVGEGSGSVAGSVHEVSKHKIIKSLFDHILLDYFASPPSLGLELS